MLLVSSSSYSCLFPGVIVGESWAAWPGVETSGRSKKNGQRRKRLRVELEICEWSLLMKMIRATCLIFSLAQVVATLLMMCDSWWALSVANSEGCCLPAISHQGHTKLHYADRFHLLCLSIGFQKVYAFVSGLRNLL